MKLQLLILSRIQRLSPAALKTHFLYANYQPATGQIYTDPTGHFLVPSVSGNSYILVAYNYNSNFIHAEPMRNRTKEVILAAYQFSPEIPRAPTQTPEA